MYKTLLKAKSGGSGAVLRVAQYRNESVMVCGLYHWGLTAVHSLHLSVNGVLYHQRTNEELSPPETHTDTFSGSLSRWAQLKHIQQSWNKSA